MFLSLLEQNCGAIMVSALFRDLLDLLDPLDSPVVLVLR